jgi:hypothetical protein
MALQIAIIKQAAWSSKDQGGGKRRGVGMFQPCVGLIPPLRSASFANMQANRNNRSLNQQVEWMLMQCREHEGAKPILDELRAMLEEAKRKR